MLERRRRFAGSVRHERSQGGCWIHRKPLCEILNMPLGHIPLDPLGGCWCVRPRCTQSSTVRKTEGDTSDQIWWPAMQLGKSSSAC